MLQQLRRLTHPLSSAGAKADALAVYAEPPTPGDLTTTVARAAREQGFEGVACVDDAARAIVMYCLVWRRWRSASARLAAHRLLRFLAYMQDEDGRFVNFVLDWDGNRNCTGRTSYPGGPAWQARALHALACAVATFGGTEWDERFRRGLVWLDPPMPYLDVRSVGVLAVLEHWRATADPASAGRALAWSTELADNSSGGRLLNLEGSASIHLWGHLQEAALAGAGTELGQPHLVACARTSADALLLPLVDGAFDADHVLPFDVSCTVAGLAAVGQATGEKRYTDAAACGRRWFLGRNSARQPVWDRGRGLVYDGIDGGQVSRNSGAESNIEGALAWLGPPE